MLGYRRGKITGRSCGGVDGLTAGEFVSGYDPGWAT